MCDPFYPKHTMFYPFYSDIIDTSEMVKPITECVYNFVKTLIYVLINHILSLSIHKHTNCFLVLLKIKHYISITNLLRFLRIIAPPPAENLGPFHIY